MRYGERLKTKEIEMSKESTASGGIGFSGLLTIVFIILKLIGKITWSWIWVLSPLWIGAILGILVLIVVWVIVVKEAIK